MSALVELRVLEGPNLYFPRAAIKLTLDISALSEAPEETSRRLAERVGLVRARVGAPGTGLRQHFATRVVARLVRAVAREAGTSRLAVRVRTTGDPVRLVVAYPWRHRGRAEALARAVADVLDGLPEVPVDPAVSTAARRVAGAEPGPGPTTLTPRVPVVAVTGTNGKTTTSRMIAHIARTDGRHVGWSSTDGIYVDGVLVEAGDYSGPSGAGRVLAHSEVELAVTETARGGILLKGIGVTRNDVSVVTNVTADHLGLHGIDTVDQLAEVKSVVPRITRRSGWSVLNAEDPRVLAMRSVAGGRPWLFARNPDAPGLRAGLDEGGRATTVIDGWLCVLAPGTDPDPLLPLVDVPMTMSGLSRFNVENALAAASAALAVGIPRAVVMEGLRTFLPDATHNPGRMNLFSLGGVSILLDLAHNEAGLEAMLEVMAGVRGPGGRLRLALGVVGDRQDELITALAEIGARDSDEMVVAHKERFLRGRTVAELDALLTAGAARMGVAAPETFPTEVAGLAALVERAGQGDVVGLMCHAERQAAYDWIAERGGTPDGPDELRAKVLAARGATGQAGSAGEESVGT